MSLVQSRLATFPVFLNIFRNLDRRKNRIPSIEYVGFNAITYLAENPDVSAAIDAGFFLIQPYITIWPLEWQKCGRGLEFLRVFRSCGN